MGWTLGWTSKGSVHGIRQCHKNIWALWEWTTPQLQISLKWPQKRPNSTRMQSRFWMVSQKKCLKIVQDKRMMEQMWASVWRTWYGSNLSVRKWKKEPSSLVCLDDLIRHLRANVVKPRFLNEESKQLDRHQHALVRNERVTPFFIGWLMLKLDSK